MGRTMSNQRRAASPEGYETSIGWVLLAAWSVYLLTLFPVLSDRILSSLFAILTAFLGLFGALLALRRHRRWITVVMISSCLLIGRYVFYWAEVRERIISTSPQADILTVIAKIFASGIAIFLHKVSSGHLVGAVLTLFNEFLMPLLQLAIIIFGGVVAVRYRIRK